MTPMREALSVDQLQNTVANPIALAGLVAGDQLHALALRIRDQRPRHRDQRIVPG